MHRPSPSSRLVIGAISAAVVVFVLVGAIRAQNHTTDVPSLATGTATGTASPMPTLESQAAAGSAIDATPSRAPSSSPSAVPTIGSLPTAKATPRATPKIAACKATDQDRYVYNPDRLEVLASCIHVTGMVDAVRREADGDFHILLRLDPAYTHLLTPANQGEELGDLVVEPVCVKSVTQTDAIETCAADPDPMSGPFPVVGDHIWMEGRYVLDLEHGGWAELHPLYRWGYH